MFSDCRQILFYLFLCLLVCQNRGLLVAFPGEPQSLKNFIKIVVFLFVSPNKHEKNGERWKGDGVTLSMKKAPEGTPVYCKMEKNSRFLHPKTVKLHAGSTYRMDISFLPPRDLEFLTIDGKEIVAKEKSRGSTANAYTTYYSTGGSIPNKKGTRHIMTITMKVQNSGEVSTKIQVKFYKQSDSSHCEWGSKLHCIELDCSNYDANIIKETLIEN